MASQTLLPAPRSLQEWMERTGTNSLQLLKRLRKEQGLVMSPTLFSFILRGSRRCSGHKALALHAITGVPVDVLTEWPKVSETEKYSGKRPKRVA